MFSFPRESFPFDQQFNILMRFIVDQTQTPNLKVRRWRPSGAAAAAFLLLLDSLTCGPQVKVAILKYIESLARQMDPTDFVNSSETRLAVSRIITWTTEPKSSDVRKVRMMLAETIHVPASGSFPAEVRFCSGSNAQNVVEQQRWFCTQNQLRVRTPGLLLWAGLSEASMVPC